jgi:hypothetical protein
LGPGFFKLLVVDQNFSGEDEGLSALSRGSQPALDQKFVEPDS